MKTFIDGSWSTEDATDDEIRALLPEAIAEDIIADKQRPDRKRYVVIDGSRDLSREALLRALSARDPNGVAIGQALAGLPEPALNLEARFGSLFDDPVIDDQHVPELFIGNNTFEVFGEEPRHRRPRRPPMSAADRRAKRKAQKAARKAQRRAR